MEGIESRQKSRLSKKASIYTRYRQIHLEKKQRLRSHDDDLSEVVVMKRDAKLNQQMSKIKSPLKIFIDGPFGAPASNIFRAEHAVLIATGIGVTPFSSILQSIMYRYLAGKLMRFKHKHILK